ncbi:MAG: hypothetical protein AB7F99_00155 [Vicinamibacterales bacterium]
MIPGEWVARRRQPSIDAAPSRPAATWNPSGQVDSSHVPVTVAAESPRWAQMSFGVALLLAVMLLAMWGASWADAL